MRSLKLTFPVKSYETDHAGLLKPFAFMNHTQEMAGEHAIRLGFGYDDLIKNGNVWVLSRFHVKFLRMPRWRELLEMETWHKGTDRLFGFRDFRVCDTSGEEIILATSSWLVINYETRRLQRMESIMNSSAGGAAGSDAAGSVALAPHKEAVTAPLTDAIKEPACKLVAPDGMQKACTRGVSLSDIDINKHTNNARYVEWALDAIDPSISFNMTVKEMWINFNNESLPGDLIDIYTVHKSDNQIFIEGKRGDLSIFTLTVFFLKSLLYSTLQRVAYLKRTGDTL